MQIAGVAVAPGTAGRLATAAQFRIPMRVADRKAAAGVPREEYRQPRLRQISASQPDAG
jgi:hypothetical protein